MKRGIILVLGVIPLFFAQLVHSETCIVLEDASIHLRGPFTSSSTVNARVYPSPGWSGYSWNGSNSATTIASNTPYYSLDGSNSTNTFAYGWSGSSWYQIGYFSRGGITTNAQAVIAAWNAGGTIIPHGSSPSSLYPNGCEDLADPCEDQINNLNDNCGVNNWTWIDEESCNGECICDPDQLNSDVNLCSEGGLADINYNTCTVLCEECSDSNATLIEDCGSAGTIEVGRDGCGGRCRNCNDYWNDATADCADRGGIDDAFCDESQGKIVWSKDVTCKSEVTNPEPEPNDPLESPEEKPDKPDDSTPENDPTETPDPAAQDTNDEVGNAWLKSIKGNTDKLIDQGNNTNDILHNIASNVKTGIDNQVKTGDAFNSMARSIDKLSATVSNIGRGVESQQPDMSGVEERLDKVNQSLSTDGVDFTTVEDPTDYTSDEYKILDSEIEGEYGKTDAELRAKLDEIDVYNQSFSDFVTNTQLRLSGSNACIDGAVMNSNFNFCFDGYQGIWLSMGQLMLAMSYIQAFFIIVGRR